MAQVRSVGIAGGGLMGSGIAHVSAQAGFDTVVCEVDAGSCGRARRAVDASLDRAVAREKLSAGAADAARARLRFTVDHADLGGCDVVIEAVVEDLEVKRALWSALDAVLPGPAIFASNTSSLGIGDQARATGRPDRFCGMHFFSPVPAMKLVEVVRGPATSEATMETVLALARRMGKVPIVTRDTPGFVVNLLLVPYMLNAIRAAQDGVATVAEIDLGMQLGAGHPVGPLTLCDAVGLDTLARVAAILRRDGGEHHQDPPHLLERLVAAGRLGRKTGVGFYDYSVEPPVPCPFPS